METSSTPSSSGSGNDTGELIRSANAEIDTHLRSLAEQEAALLHRESQLKGLMTKMSERQKQFTAYTDDLLKRKQALDIEKQHFVEEYKETIARIDEEVDSMAKTLANLQHENALLTDRRTTADSSVTQSKRKIEDLERQEENLRALRTKLKEKIAEFERAAPKRTPEKLKLEIDLLNNNIYQAKKQIKEMEDIAVNLELKAISCKTELALLAQSESRIREEKTKLLAIDEVQMDAKRKQLDVQIEMHSISEAKQLETNACIERVREIISDWKALDSDKKARIKRVIERMEQLKDSIQDRKLELETIRSCAQNTNDLLEEIHAKRQRFESEKSTEFSLLKRKSSKTQKRLGQMLFYKNEAEGEVNSLNDFIEDLDKTIGEEDVLSQNLADKKKEIDEMIASDAKADLAEQEKVENDVQLLDSLQRKIAFARQDEKDMRVESMKLIQPKTIHRPEPTQRNSKKLKKELKAELNTVEELGFQVEAMKAQLESKKKELLMVKSEVDHSSLVYRKVKRESNALADINSMEQKQKLYRMEQDNLELTVKIQRKQRAVNDRKKELQTRIKHIHSVEDQQGIRLFGENVALHVDRFARDATAFNKSERRHIDAGILLALERIDWQLRKIRIEKSIWCDYAKPASYAAQLESWNEQLNTLIEK